MRSNDTDPDHADNDHEKDTTLVSRSPPTVHVESEEQPLISRPPNYSRSLSSIQEVT